MACCRCTAALRWQCGSGSLSRFAMMSAVSYSRMAFHAVRGADGAVQIDDDVAAVACFFVERVEILRGEQRQQPCLFQLDERLVRGARLRVPYWRFLLPAPGILAVFLIGGEATRRCRTRSFAQGCLVQTPSGPRKSGNACGRGDARALSILRSFCSYLHTYHRAVSSVCVFFGFPTVFGNRCRLTTRP